MRLNILPAALAERSIIEMFDDFISYVDTQTWTKSGTGATIATQASGLGGILSLATSTSANAVAIVAATNKFFKFVAKQPIYAEAYVQYTEANTNKAAVAFGLSSVVDNTLLADTTGVPVSSFSGALIYKPAGTTNWSAACSVGSTQSITASSISAQPSGSAYQRLSIEVRDVDGSNLEITYFVDDQPLLDNTAWRRPIKHQIALSGAAAMAPVAWLKGTNGTNAETLLVDHIAAYQRRNPSLV